MENRNIPYKIYLSENEKPICRRHGTISART